MHAVHSRCPYIWLLHAPVGVKGRDGCRPPWVLWQCLLQQDALHQPGDVHVDVAGKAVQAGGVASQANQELWRTCYLLGGLVVICHSHDDPGETFNQQSVFTGPESNRSPTTAQMSHGDMLLTRLCSVNVFVCLFLRQFIVTVLENNKCEPSAT